MQEYYKYLSPHCDTTIPLRSRQSTPIVVSQCANSCIKYLSPHCDTTIGVDWRDRKGIVFTDEFRWARSPESYTQINAQYAVERDRFLQKNKNVVKATDHNYWINGKDFRFFPQVVG